ncbi:MAG TPA: hypothetical protein VI408_16855 [Gaiellaceae bacterium]
MTASAHAGISPSLVHRGGKTTISVKTPTRGVGCTASLTYSDGSAQISDSRKPANGHVSFVLSIPRNAALGGGYWRVNCGLRTWQGSFVVVGAASSTDAPRVVADSQGFSQRNDSYGTGSLLSYGVILHDLSPKEDAQNVYVIVNMVDAGGALVGSKSQTVNYVPAGGTYALGDSLQLRTQERVAKLEITIRVGAHAPHKSLDMPDFANVRLVPGDPGWVGEVDGEVVNDASAKTLSNANLSIVVLDASGNPVGGGTGFSFAPVPSGARFVFLAQTGFTAIPLDRAASVLVSVTPTWVAPTS